VYLTSCFEVQDYLRLAPVLYTHRTELSGTIKDVLLKFYTQIKLQTERFEAKIRMAY